MCVDAVISCSRKRLAGTKPLNHLSPSTNSRPRPQPEGWSSPTRELPSPSLSRKKLGSGVVPSEAQGLTEFHRLAVSLQPSKPILDRSCAAKLSSPDSCMTAKVCKSTMPWKVMETWLHSMVHSTTLLYMVIFQVLIKFDQQISRGDPWWSSVDSKITTFNKRGICHCHVLTTEGYSKLQQPPVVLAGPITLRSSKAINVTVRLSVHCAFKTWTTCPFNK